MDTGAEIEAKFAKAKANKTVENAGLLFLRRDPRIQIIPTITKVAILETLGVEGAFGPQTFDAVMTSKPVDAIDLNNLVNYVDDLTLLEMKTTRKAIKNANLNGFFFGATEREYELATHLGDRYRFAFVVLNSDNDYGQYFAVLIPLREVARRTRARR